jgi:hypothetical protein
MTFALMYTTSLYIVCVSYRVSVRTMVGGGEVKMLKWVTGGLR